MKRGKLLSGSDESFDCEHCSFTTFVPPVPQPDLNNFINNFECPNCGLDTSGKLWRLERVMPDGSAEYTLLDGEWNGTGTTLTGGSTPLTLTAAQYRKRKLHPSNQ